MNRLCVFCGSSKGFNAEYEAAAVAVGEMLAGQGIELVYGGGCVGLMGILADTVLAKGGKVIGVIPRHLAGKEIAHYGLQDLRIVESMHERKALMADLSDGFMALPGGYGTFEEFFEIITWLQLGLHPKPAGLLNVRGYYDPLLAQVDRSIEEGFIRKEQRALILSSENAEELLDQMKRFVPLPMPKWLSNTRET